MTNFKYLFVWSLYAGFQAILNTKVSNCDEFRMTLCLKRMEGKRQEPEFDQVYFHLEDESGPEVVTAQDLDERYKIITGETEFDSDDVDAFYSDEIVQTLFIPNYGYRAMFLVRNTGMLFLSQPSVVHLFPVTLPNDANMYAMVNNHLTGRPQGAYARCVPKKVTQLPRYDVKQNAAVLVTINEKGNVDSCYIIDSEE